MKLSSFVLDLFSSCRGVEKRNTGTQKTFSFEKYRHDVGRTTGYMHSARTLQPAAAFFHWKPMQLFSQLLIDYIMASLKKKATKNRKSKRKMEDARKASKADLVRVAVEMKARQEEMARVADQARFANEERLSEEQARLAEEARLAAEDARLAEAARQAAAEEEDEREWQRLVQEVIYGNPRFSDSEWETEEEWEESDEEWNGNVHWAPNLGGGQGGQQPDDWANWALHWNEADQGYDTGFEYLYDDDFDVNDDDDDDGFFSR